MWVLSLLQQCFSIADEGGSIRNERSLVADERFVRCGRASRPLRMSVTSVRNEADARPKLATTKVRTSEPKGTDCRP